MVPVPDAGSSVDAAIPYDAGDYDPVLGVPFEGPVSFDPARVQRIDPSGLRQGASPCRAPVLGRVYRIIDGDTVRFTASDGSLDQTVRMIGIDTPEIAHDGMAAECFGPEASTFSENLLDQTVWLTFDNGCFDTFDRLLAYVHIGPGAGDLWQRQLLQRGFARAFTFGSNRTFSSTFNNDESAAQRANAGMWDACF